VKLRKGILTIEEIPLPSGYVRRNLLPWRDFVKRKPGGKWLAVGRREASTADSSVLK
jgi:hypothetical protein